MIKYIGSKRLLVPHIVRGVSAFPEDDFVDLEFSGYLEVLYRDPGELDVVIPDTKVGPAETDLTRKRPV